MCYNIYYDEKVEVEPDATFYRYAFKLEGRYYGVHTGKLLRQGVWNHAKTMETYLTTLRGCTLRFGLVKDFKGYGVFYSLFEAREALDDAARPRNFNTVLLEVEIKGKIRRASTILGKGGCLIAGSIRVVKEVE